MFIKRRRFIAQSSLVTAGTLFVPKFLQAAAGPLYKGTAEPERILIVIQLSGGNDGLNTVIPISNDIYYQSRPSIGIAANKAAVIHTDAALHPALTAFQKMYDQGELAILNNVGYPNPDRSHFRSMDIWHSASSSHDYWNTGWLGRYLDHACHGCDKPTQVLEINDVLSLALKGEQHKGIATQDPAQLFATSSAPYFKQLAKHDHPHEPLADYLYKTLADTINSAESIFTAAKAGSTNSIYPNTALAKHLKTVASLIAGGMNTSVYYLSLGSFDTHVNQAAQQQRLLAELNGAVEAFVADIKKQNRFKDVLLMTFSEFGRRVAQNASAGTDHGAANNMFFVSGSLKEKGLLNSMPKLQQLVNGDIPFDIDFRRVLATVLQQWLKTDPTPILKESFQALSFV
jgi:uncharacterized protein (DUF1501 family)